MLHLMKYRMISLFRERSTIFWSMVFPLLLGTMFYVGFGNLKTDIEKIPVAVVCEKETEETKNFQTYLDELEKADEPIIKQVEIDEDELENALKDKRIQGYYTLGESRKLTISGNGIEETILKSLLDAYNTQEDFYKTIAEEHPEKLIEALENQDYLDFAEKKTINGKEVDANLQYFFALISMACLFGGYIGFHIAEQLQANVSAVGMRRAVTPTHKLKQILSDITVGFLVQCFNTTLLIVYLKYILKVDLGNDMPRLILVAVVGNLIGVTLGMFIGSIGKLSEGAKEGLLLAVSLGSSFLAGLMISTIKGAIELHCPIINRVNPAALISDAIYSITMYEDPVRYQNDIVTMIVIAVILIFGTFFMTRRVRYDSL